MKARKQGREVSGGAGTQLASEPRRDATDAETNRAFAQVLAEDSHVFAARGTITIPKNRPPTTPGEILLECYLKPLGVTRHTFAAQLDMSALQLRALLRGTHAVTTETAILLGRALKTSPDFWMNAQAATDLYKAREKLAGKVGRPRKKRRRGPARPASVQLASKPRRDATDAEAEAAFAQVLAEDGPIFAALAAYDVGGEPAARAAEDAHLRGEPAVAPRDRTEFDERYAVLLARRVPLAEIVVGRAYVIHARNGGVGVAVREEGTISTGT
jgi:antitoxin HigA-1